MTLNELADMRCEIFMAHYTFSSSPENWVVNIKREEAGVKIEINATGPTYEEAINNALAKWTRTTQNLPEFKGAVISHYPPNEHPIEPFNDEIPY